MARKFNNSDPTANTAIGNVMKHGGGTKRTLIVQFVGEHCLVRGPGLSELLDQVAGGDAASWSASAGAFIVKPEVARALVVTAQRYHYEISANG